MSTVKQPSSDGAEQERRDEPDAAEQEELREERARNPGQTGGSLYGDPRGKPYDGGASPADRNRGQMKEGYAGSAKKGAGDGDFGGNFDVGDYDGSEGKEG